LKVLLERFPDDDAILADAAGLAANSGHAARSRAFYERALSRFQGGDSPLALRYADHRQGWGDFYGAERTYREWLRSYPEDNAVRLRLAGLLASSQRYEEAEGIYRKMLTRNDRSLEALRGMAAVRLAAMDFGSAVDWADQALQIDPGDLDALWIKADALFLTRRDGVAWRCTSPGRPSPTGLPSLDPNGKIRFAPGIGKGRDQLFARGMKSASDNPPYRHLAAGKKAGSEPTFMDSLAKQGLSPRGFPNGPRLREMGMKSAAVQPIVGRGKGRRLLFPPLGLAEDLASESPIDPAIEELVSCQRGAWDPRSCVSGPGLCWSRATTKLDAVCRAAQQGQSHDPVPC
jgi:tetratricopeptide (TPR) repeat protein